MLAKGFWLDGHMNIIGQARIKGFTLVELMVVIAVLAIISAIALPIYSGYIQTSREGTLRYNISTIEVFQEDFRLRTGSYLTNAANTAAITAAIGWDPQDDDNDYRIADGGGGAYEVTAVSPEGTIVCISFPSGDPC